MAAITGAVDTAFGDGSLVTIENGGTADTAAIAARMLRALDDRLVLSHLPV